MKVGRPVQIFAQMRRIFRQTVIQVSLIFGVVIYILIAEATGPTIISLARGMSICPLAFTGDPLPELLTRGRSTWYVDDASVTKSFDGIGEILLENVPLGKASAIVFRAKKANGEIVVYKQYDPDINIALYLREIRVTEYLNQVKGIKMPKILAARQSDRSLVKEYVHGNAVRLRN